MNTVACDWILWMDFDSLFTNMKVSIQDLLNNVSRVSVGQYLSTAANVVTNIVLNNGGCYTTNTPPAITISGGAGTGATAIASMAASTSLSSCGRGLAGSR